MNCPTLGLRVASAVFGLISLGHLIRIVFGMWLQIGSLVIGRRWSLVAVIVFAALCAWMWKLACQTAKAKVDAAPAGPTT